MPKGIKYDHREYSIYATDVCWILTPAGNDDLVLDAAPLELECGVSLQIGAQFMEMRGHKASAGFFQFKAVDGKPLEYRGLYHSSHNGRLACFTQLGNPHMTEKQNKWFFAWTWLEDHKSFCFATAGRAGRLVETAVYIPYLNT